MGAAPAAAPADGETASSDEGSDGSHDCWTVEDSIGPTRASDEPYDWNQGVIISEPQPFSDGLTPEARAAAEAADEEAYQAFLAKLEPNVRTAYDEIDWTIESEIPAVIGRVRRHLIRCHHAIHDAKTPSAAVAPCRGGSEEEGLLVAGVVNAWALHALRVQVSLPAARAGGAPHYTAMVGGGERVTFELHQLLKMRVRVDRAVGYLGTDIDCLPAAFHLLTRLTDEMIDMLDSIWSADPPTEPSEDAADLTELLVPAAPADVLVDARLCGRPPQLYLSAYLTGPPAPDPPPPPLEPHEKAVRDAAGESYECGGYSYTYKGEPPPPVDARGKPPTVVEARHVVVPADAAIGARLEEVKLCVDEALALLEKIDILQEMEVPEPPALTHGPWAWAAPCRDDWTRNRGGGPYR